MLNLLKLSEILSLDSVLRKRKIICFLFQTMKNYCVWRKYFERFITILNVWADITVLLFQLVSIFRKLGFKFGSFFTKELKILHNNLIQYLYLFFLVYYLRYAKRLVTWYRGQLQGRCVVWISSWVLQIHCNPSISLGANHLVWKVWIEIDDTVLQRIHVTWYRICILRKSFARPFEVN